MDQSPDLHPKWRLRARAALEAYFRNRSHPRLTLGLLVTVAGLAGFLISRTLLRHGLEAMWLRYPVAVVGGYCVFLVQLRIWVEIERARYDPGKVRISIKPPREQQSPGVLDRFSRGDSGSWLDWLDIPGSLDFGEGCLVGCVFALIVGLVAGVGAVLFSFVLAGSEFFAEVFLDAVVVSLLYRHLKTAATEHWLGTAVKRTWTSVLITAAGLSLFGASLAGLAPNSHSIGPALKEIFSADSPK